MKERIDRCVNMYALLAAAPVASILSSDGKIDQGLLHALCEETVKKFVKDNNLVRPIIYSFFEGRDLSALSRTSDRISWGNTGNVRDAFASSQKIESAPDRLFRENIHRLQDWLSALDTVRNNMKKIQEAAEQNGIQTTEAYRVSAMGEQLHKSGSVLRKLAPYAMASAMMALSENWEVLKDAWDGKGTWTRALTRTGVDFGGYTVTPYIVDGLLAQVEGKSVIAASLKNAGMGYTLGFIDKNCKKSTAGLS